MSATLTRTWTGVMNVFSPKGDIKIHWDKAKRGSVAKARKEFEDLKKRGFAFFRMNADGTTGEQIREFDPEAGEIVAVPPVAGG